MTDDQILCSARKYFKSCFESNTHWLFSHKLLTKACCSAINRVLSLRFPIIIRIKASVICRHRLHILSIGSGEVNFGRRLIVQQKQS